MTPSADGKGLLLSYGKYIESFKCTSQESCSFEPTDIIPRMERNGHIMLTVPSSLLSDCYFFDTSSASEIYEEPTDEDYYDEDYHDEDYYDEDYLDSIINSWG